MFHYFDHGVLIQSPVFFFSSTGAFLLLLGFFARTFFCISFFGVTFALEPTLKEPIPPEVGAFGPSNPPMPAIFPCFESSVGPLVTGIKANVEASEVTATKSLTKMLGCMVDYC
mmetsp:Transcript_16/g.26  ORF Transcript_16/g.26 Transcript_16/m.26 type:complete len:114 (-) Transcript_16:104-445(-)